MTFLLQLDVATLSHCSEIELDDFEESVHEETGQCPWVGMTSFVNFKIQLFHCVPMEIWTHLSSKMQFLRISTSNSNPKILGPYCR